MSRNPLAMVARRLIMEHFGNALRVGGCFIHDFNGMAREQGRAIFVIDGCFLDPIYGRLSNYWTWRYVQKDGSLSVKTQSGYGGGENFFRPVSKCEAKAWTASHS